MTTGVWRWQHTGFGLLVELPRGRTTCGTPRNGFCLGRLPFPSINHRSANHHCAKGHQHNAVIAVKRIIVGLVLASVLRRVVILLGTTSKAQSRESYYCQAGGLESEPGHTAQINPAMRVLPIACLWCYLGNLVWPVPQSDLASGDFRREAEILRAISVRL